MTRISYRRTTPEGWEQTIKRMITLNNLTFEPAEARDVLRYLADHHGLAPEEAKPAAFEVERRQIEYTYAGDKDTERAVHDMPLDGPRHLAAAHEGRMDAAARNAPRHLSRHGHRVPAGRWPATTDCRSPAPLHQTTGIRWIRRLEHLSSAFPLTSTEWAAWSATMRPPQLAGRWALAGYQPGRGSVFGQVVVTGQGDPEQRRIHHGNDVHLRARRSNGDAARPWPGLHRLSMARPIERRGDIVPDPGGQH